ncbi:hypothetical protein Bca52824_046305 [Brassica carinata]|uniref:Secreted protein n=1 Tax=Brassica carinata TaxID=52824 RepID=A0A8X7USC1_BRACI|nr:hypothetical protein Bca52824_046305 [Brassica carinata]
MIFHIIILVLIALGSYGRLCFSHQPPTNQSNSNTSFPVNQIGSQLLEPPNSTESEQSDFVISGLPNPARTTLIRPGTQLCPVRTT